MAGTTSCPNSDRSAQTGSPMVSHGVLLNEHSLKDVTARDFEHPVAAFELDMSGWEIVYKLCGTFWCCTQQHSPFDVVAWHGNCRSFYCLSWLSC